MKWKITLIVAIIIGAVAGSWIKNLPGFVIIAYEKTTYEMRLWVAVSIILAVLATLFLIGLFIRSLLSGASKIRGWQGERHWRKSRKKTIKGMLAFVEGRWKQSEKTMIAAAKNSDTQLINYLIAAQSAQQQHAEDRRDLYLRLAHQAEPHAKVAIGLTQARLQLEGEQYELALATLNALKTDNPNHPFILKLLFSAHKKLNDWSAIIELLPALKKYKVLDDEELQRVESESVKQVLKMATDLGDLEALKQRWASLPSASQKNSDIIICYSQQLIRFAQMDEAERLIKPLFKKNPSEQVIELFGEIISPDGAKQFNFLENWLNSNPQAPSGIYLSLGKIAFNIALWGKARFYLERALRHQPTGEVYFYMAKTLQKLDDDAFAEEIYRQGLEFIVQKNIFPATVKLIEPIASVEPTNILPKFEEK